MKAIDKIKGYCENLETAKLVVPEFDNLEVFVKPMSLKAHRDIMKKTDGLDDVTSALTAIITFALDENGDNLFTVEDKPTLLRLEGAADLLEELAGRILNAHRVANPLD